MNMFDLIPWLEYIPDKSAAQDKRWRKWFQDVFEELHERGFNLNSRSRDIEDGATLMFTRLDNSVQARRFIQTQSFSKPGLILTNEDESWEIILTVDTPMYIVKKAIYELLPEERHES